MASFDFIDISAKGYEFAWKNKSYLARVAIPVIFIKIVCLLAIFVLGAQEMYLRQGLISVPSFVIEAVFVIGLIRYIVYKEPILIWGKRVPAPEYEGIPAVYNGVMLKKQSMQGGIAIYLLMCIIESAMSGWQQEFTAAKMLESQPEKLSPQLPMDVMDAQSISPVVSLFVMLLSLVIIIWTFRFFWLFIPVAMGYSFSDFLKRTFVFKTSISMIATWFVCSLPLILLYAIILQVFTGGFSEGSAESIIIQALLQTMAELAIIVVQVSAMTFGIVHILSSKPVR